MVDSGECGSPARRGGALLASPAGVSAPAWYSLTPAPYQNIELKHNDRQIGTILSDFRAARERQVELLTGFRPDDYARTAWHARLKVAMRLVDHLLFIAEHDDHHLARIWELRRA
jgi:hypothetical protein